LLSTTLPQHPALLRGQLPNGLRYVVLPNKTPANRFEAHLEMHVGSVDEEVHEQGMAHFVEHVTFLGSKKREALLGTGSRSNAYTDFHHTVFHVHSPLVNGATGQEMLPQVIDALHEIAFAPQFLTSRVEKERRAVLAESRMMNTIEYRVDCSLLQFLHEENNLGKRFPIGEEDLVQKWDTETLKEFWTRFYFPGNATLYVVGDVGDAATVERLIVDTFQDVQPGLEGGKVKDKHAFRPPVHHYYADFHDQMRPPSNNHYRSGSGITTTAEIPQTVLPSIFQHELLQSFTMNMFSKLPVVPVKTYRELRESFMGRVIMSVMQYRINALYTEGASPPFTTAEMDYSDSGREGCCVTTLTVISEPCDWREAVQAAVAEVKRVQKYGITAGEFKRYVTALLRDSEQLAEQAGSVPHLDNLEFIMESDSLNHTVMDQRQGYEALLEIVPTISLEDVNRMAFSILSYISYFGDEKAMMERALAGGEDFGSALGATATSSIVICMPSYVDESGASIGTGGSGGGGGLVDHDTLQALVEAGQVPEAADPEIEIPDGAIPFNVTAGDIQGCLAEDLGAIENVKDLDVPDFLMTVGEVDALVEARRPHFVPVDGGDDPLPGPDPILGITQRQLSNGIRVNYAVTANEPKAAMLRVVANGGRAMERIEVGPEGLSSGVVGVRALSESGKVGQWSRQQVELFCVTRLINCVIEADEEFLCMDFSFAVGDGGCRATCELVHQIVEAPLWEENAMERARQMFRSHYAGMPKSLERAIGDRTMNAMLGADRRWVDSSPEEIDATTLEAACRIVSEQLVSGNLEVNLVGDFDIAEADEAVLRLLGTIRAAPRPAALANPLPVAYTVHPPEVRNSRLHLRDSDERAAGHIVGSSPARWLQVGPEDAKGGSAAAVRRAAEQNGLMDYQPYSSSSEAEQASLLESWGQRRQHPLYMNVCLSLMAEVINSRLFTTVRDALGLTYDVSFELHNFDRLDHGWWVVTVTSTPQKIEQAVQASVNTVRGLQNQRVTQFELDRAKRNLLTRHDSDMKDNGYWVSLLTHLQNDLVPHKDIGCLQDLVRMYDEAIVADIYEAYGRLGLSEEAVYSCVGVSGPKLAPEDTFATAVAAVNEAAAAPAADAPVQGIAEAAQNGNLMMALKLALEAQQLGAGKKPTTE
jgi:predicted Zn-dependent peptidase